MFDALSKWHDPHLKQGWKAFHFSIMRTSYDNCLMIALQLFDYVIAILYIFIWLKTRQTGDNNKWYLWRLFTELHSLKSSTFKQSSNTTNLKQQFWKESNICVVWKSYGQKVLEFSSFSSRESSRPRLLLLDDDDLPKKLYYWVLCKSDLKHLNFCVSVAWFPFFALLWPRGQKLTPENYLFTFLPLFYTKYLKIFHNDEMIPFLLHKNQGYIDK